MGVIDSVHIYVLVSVEKRFSEEKVMPLGICGMSGVELFQLVTGLRDSQGLLGPVDGGVHDIEPGEAEDDIFSSISHDIEEVFWGDPFDSCVEGTSVADNASFVCSLVHIADYNRRGKFLDRELVLPNKLSVNAGDISIRVYQYGGVDNF